MTTVQDLTNEQLAEFAGLKAQFWQSVAALTEDFVRDTPKYSLSAAQQSAARSKLLTYVANKEPRLDEYIASVLGG